MSKEAFYSYLRDPKNGLFGRGMTQSQVDGIEGIFAAFDDVGDGRQDTLAYGLATAYHETGARMVPVREGFASTDNGARAAVNKLAKQRGPKSAVARYALPAGPWGHVYYGRGHVQLTWLENYERSSADAGTDLARYPDKMLDPVVSARVLFKGLLDGRWGGGKGLRMYLDRGDYVGARRTVNGTDKAVQIAGYAKAFITALEAMRPIPKTETVPIPEKVTGAKPLPKAGFLGMIAKIFGGVR